jgi:peptidoglycan/xylan/chitin deacetylase (PgdA/CDA1 family)
MDMTTVLPFHIGTGIKSRVARMLETASSRSLYKGAKSSIFSAARRLGLFQVSRYLRRNSKSLLILCYHGISKSDEDLWKPSLYMDPVTFRRRLATIRSFGLDVLPLADALGKIEAGTLKRPAVALTFDDGWHDFYTSAWPLLREFGYPATVYQTTYYAYYNRPVFDTTCSYLLWKGMGRTVSDPGHMGLPITVRLDSMAAVDETAKQLRFFANETLLGGEEKDRALAILAEQLGVDLKEILRTRTLHLMNPTELAEVARHDISVELHTHRHKLPMDRVSFLEEIAQNRQLIRAATGKIPKHFCYPNGAHRPETTDWLREAGVTSATTCDPGLVSKGADMMLLPRVTDSNNVSQARFESWLAGIGVFGPAVQRSYHPSGSVASGSVSEHGLPAERADVSSVL